MPALPTGTVTLLFIGLEGSTVLLHQLGERYALLLDECRQLLRAAFLQWGGHAVDMQGETFSAAFARATDAVAAAVSIQRALASYRFPEAVAVRMRMGLHTGEPQLTSEGYVGLDVHCVARMMSAGHGGQVLLSQTTRDLVEHHLPDGVSVRDLGEHRLTDLQHPRRLFQLVMAGLSADFAPLLTLDARPNNLPVQPTPFIGREREMAAVCRLLRRADVRLLTLIGPGGVGKTRLGLQAAAELSELFADGVYFVALAPLNDAALVLPTIAQTLGIREAGSQPLLKSLQEELLPQQGLLLLDNFEQVVTAGIMVADLLAACPKLKALVTSRTVLHVRAEHEFAVPPLALPTPKQRLPDLVTLSQYEAVALFIERAQAVKPDFQITNTNAPAVAEICTRLDGLPLAIELAAARSKVYPPQTLLARLKQGLSILAGGARDLPVRQQTLHGTIAWSYDLLEPKEQRLFRRLAVFANGCTVQAAEQVCMAGAQLQGDILEELASLVDKSLLRQEEQGEGEVRIWMLQTLREFGLERLAEAGETEVTRATHAAYYLAQAEEAEPHLRGTEQVSWLARLDQEYENLRVALAYLLERAEIASEQAEMALRLSGALWWFWVVRGYCREGWSFLERALARSEGVRASVQGKALYAAGWLADLQDDYGQAEALLSKSLVLFRESGDKRGMANALYTLGNVARTRCDYATANALLQEAVQLFNEVGDTWGRANSLIRLARVSIVQGQYTAARSLLEESLVLSRAIGDKRGIGYALANLALLLFFSQSKPAKAHALAEEGLVLFREVGDKQLTAYALRILGQLILQQGDAARARELAEESVMTLKEIGDRWGTAQSLLCSASVAARQGDGAAARRLYEENLALLSELEDQELIASSLEGLGQVVAAQGEPRWAARLWGRAEALRETVGAPMPPVYRADYEQAVAATCTALGEEAFDIAWTEGRTMELEQVLSAPVSGPLPEAPEARQPLAPPAGRASPAPAGLTAREVEVLRLVAQGLTDKQIAEQLVIARRTVNWYLTSIYSKIGVSSRSGATHYAMEQHLVV